MCLKSVKSTLELKLLLFHLKPKLIHKQDIRYAVFGVK